MFTKRNRVGNDVEATNEQIDAYLEQCNNFAYIGIQLAKHMGTPIYAGSNADGQDYVYIRQDATNEVIDALAKAFK